MVKEIIWTPDAEETLDSVIDYLHEHWSEKVTENFIRRVDEVIEHISRNPLACRTAGREDVREALITKHNLLLYRIAGKSIYLLYFWDTRNNPATKPWGE